LSYTMLGAFAVLTRLANKDAGITFDDFSHRCRAFLRMPGSATRTKHAGHAGVYGSILLLF
jgi:hypothetical protein